MIKSIVGFCLFGRFLSFSLRFCHIYSLASLNQSIKRTVASSSTGLSGRCFQSPDFCSSRDLDTLSSGWSLFRKEKW
uniref:Secreted protein n=1 Tax=Salix viminalis TaxID=40686 RepID=A0A6N2LAM8_SALVM